MTLDRLKSLVPPKLRKKIPALYGHYLEATPDGTIEGFLADMVDRQLMSEGVYRRVLMAANDTVTLGDFAALRDPAPQGLRMVGLLGQGGMGEVYVARDPVLQRTVAVKNLFPNMLEREDLVRRFYNEVQITAQLEHPGIPPVHSLHTDEQGVPSYTMKLVRGLTIKQYLRKAIRQQKDGKSTQANSLPARLEVFLKICDAMAYAHAKGVIHRDLKPDNIMVGAHHQVLVMDWGIARIINGPEPVSGAALTLYGPDNARPILPGENADDSLTAAGQALGTPAYMSPEQAAGHSEKLGPASDQYSLGLILFELVQLERGRIRGDSALSYLVENAREPITQGKKAAGMAPELVAIVNRATHIRPENRYESVTHLADDVRRFMQNEAVQALPDTPTQRAARYLSRHRMGALSAILGLSLFSVLVGVATLMSGAAALEAHRVAAAAREIRLLELGGIVQLQAQEMDAKLAHYQQLLSGLSYAAELTLTHPTEPRPYFLSTEFETGNPPSDLQFSALYNAKISVAHSDIHVASGVSEADVTETIHRLVPLEGALRRAILQSHSEQAQTLAAAAQRALIADKGGPVVWTYVTTANGVMISTPGSATPASDEYDPRTMAWYSRVSNQRSRKCDSEGIDEAGLGILLTCSQPLRDAHDNFLGVAALDIKLAWFIEHLLDPPPMGAPVTAYVIDSQQMVQIHSGLKDKAAIAKTWTLAPFEHREVLRGRGPRGHLERDGKLLIWTQVPAMEWTYVVVGDADALLK